jgi:hypothetical protein
MRVAVGISRQNINWKSQPMTAKPTTRPFLIALMRPVFQTAVVMVEASSKDHAISRALHRAPTMSDGRWKGRYDDRHYRYHILDVVDVELERKMQSEELRGTPIEADTRDLRYMLLLGDVDTGEGGVLLEPWLGEQNGLMVLDLTRDWGDDIENIHDSGIENYRKEPIR